VCALALLGALAVAAQAQRVDPKLKLPPQRITVLLPDLVVRSVDVEKGADGNMQGVTIGFQNACKAAAKGKFDIAVTVKDGNKPDSKTLHTASSTFDQLAPGESHKHYFDFGALKLPMSSFIRAEVDAGNTLKEDVENNNWMERNPNRAPFPPDGSTYCKPKG
jgi:hypothetical protein